MNNLKLLLLFSITLVSCTQGFEVSSQVESTKNQSFETPNSTPSPQPNATVTPTGTLTPSPTPKPVLYGAIVGGPYDQFSAVINNNTQINIHMPLSPTSLFAEQSGKSKDSIEANYSLTPDSKGYWDLFVSLTKSQLVSQPQYLSKATLPNGDPLPFIYAQDINKVQIPMQNATLWLYFDDTVVALFFESNYDPYIETTYPIRSPLDQLTIGYYKTVPAKQSFKGGFFISSIRDLTQ